MKADITRSLYSRWLIALAIITAAAGISLTLQIRARIALTETTQARLTAETLRINTEQEFTLFAEVLESVGALHALSDEVNQAAMDEFIEKGMIHQHTVLGPFGLTQEIDPELRNILEAQAKSQSGTGYIVQQAAADGSWIPALERPDYYPLTWQSKKDGLRVPIGFDLASLPSAQETIWQIEQTRHAVLVPAPASGAPTSYWVFAPVIPKQFQSLPFPIPGTVIGFTVAKIYPQQILQKVQKLSGISGELQLNLTPADREDYEKTIRNEKGRWIYCHPLTTIGTRWDFSCSMPQSMTGHRSAEALALGLIITTLMTSQLLILGNRTRKIEEEVRARTADLHRANRCLEANLIERARLEERMHELSAKERRQIGRDLHDSLGQQLTGAVFLSRSLMNYFKTTDCEQKNHSRTLNETLKSAVAQVRNMARGLAPVILNDESLCEALQQLAEEMSGLYNIPCQVADCTILPEQTEKTKEQLYLIAREAVNNAARHANASRIAVHFGKNNNRWTLRIRDDGQGLPADRPASSGMGMRIMQHRADLIGATCSIHSTPDHGTTITVSGPLNPKLVT